MSIILLFLFLLQLAVFAQRYEVKQLTPTNGLNEDRFDIATDISENGTILMFSSASPTGFNPSNATEMTKESQFKPFFDNDFLKKFDGKQSNNLNSVPDRFYYSTTNADDTGSFLPPVQGRAYAIFHNANDVFGVGYTYQPTNPTNETFYATSWQAPAGNPVSLNTPPTQFSAGQFVDASNDGRYFCGGLSSVYTGSYTWSAVMYDKTTNQYNYYDNSFAFGVNDNGDMVGQTSDRSAALYWNNLGQQSFLTNPNVTLRNARKINYYGQIIVDTKVLDVTRSYLYENGELRKFSENSTTIFYANDLNNNSEVVGAAKKADGTEFPFYWTGDGGVRNLNDLIPQDSGWILKVAHAINDKGQIVGEGVKDGKTRAFILDLKITPIIFVPGTMGSELTGNYLGQPVRYWFNPTPSNNPTIPTLYNLTLNQSSVYYKPDLYASDVTRSYLGVQLYQPILDSLKNKGYVPYNIAARAPSQGCDDENQKTDSPYTNPSLFVFPYDFRQDNTESANSLKTFIQCVQRFYPPGTKIDILAHSQGGLVTRRYILQAQLQNTPHGLGKVITIASPFLGAPEAIYKIYTGGAWDRKFSIAVISPITLKFLAPSFPSMHQLFPSRKYHEMSGGIIFEGGNADGNGTPDETYTFPQIVSQLNLAFPATTPGTVGAGFHDTNGQDDWRQDQSGIFYNHIVAEQNALQTTTLMTVEYSAECLVADPYALTGCFRDRLYVPTKGYGDGTVPTKSASRIMRNPDGTLLDLSSPNSAWYLYTPRPTEIDEKAEHNGIHENPDTHALVAYLLGVDAEPAIPSQSITQIENDTNKTNLLPSAVSEVGGFAKYSHGQMPVERDLSNCSSSYYLSIIGKREVTVQTESGETASIQDGLLQNTIQGLTYDVIGENSIMLTFSPEHSYTVNFVSGENPMGIELINGCGNRNPTTRVKFNDVNIPFNLNTKLTFSPNNETELIYDADGNGTFDTPIIPTANLSGQAAKDITAPTPFINIVQQGNAAIATITAQDTQSGLKNIWYSTDGEIFNRYTTAFSVPYSQTPILIQAFADDNAANRSGLVLKSFTFAPTAPTLAVKPVLECVVANADLTFTAKFGYQNLNSVPVTIPVGTANKFTPTPFERGQTTTFQPGQLRNVFEVIFNGNNLVWHLKGPDNANRTATASRNSTRCQ